MTRRVLAVAVLLCLLSAAVPGGETVKTDAALGKVLIVYYSYRGATREVSRRLAESIGADLHEIETVVPYTDETVNPMAKKQLGERELPELKGTPPDLAGYDLVIIGAPVWWQNIPMPLAAFLKQIDFAGGPVAFFCTHRGVPGGIFYSFEDYARNERLVATLGINNPEETPAADVDRILAEWLGTVRQGLRTAQ